MGIFTIVFIVLSMAIFLSIKFNKKIGITIPVSIMINIFIVYLFGIFNFLNSGANFVLILSFVFIIVSIGCYIKSKERKIILHNVFTPVLMIWLLFIAFFMFYYQGAVLSAWDEFSHWGDVVKAMFSNGVLSSNRISLSAFRSYPPGNSIFQYLAQYFNGSFNQSYLFITQQILFISFTFSFLEIASIRKIYKIIIASILLFMMPTIFFDSFLNTIYVDALLGLIFGCGMLNILLNDSKERFSLITWASYVAFLPMLKDAGTLFSVILIIAVIYRILYETEFKIKKEILKKYLPVLVMIFAFLISVISWKINLKLNDAPIMFSNSVDLKTFLNVILRQDQTYRGIVFSNFMGAVSSSYIISIHNFCFSILTIVPLMMLFYILVSKFTDNKKLYYGVSIIIFVFLFIYIFGLLIMYLFKFSEYEAINLASYQRYIGIYLIGIIVIPFILLTRKCILVNEKFSLISLIIISGFFCKWKSLPASYNDHLIIADTMEQYNRYSKIISDKLPNGKFKINFVSTKSQGYDYWVMKFYLRDKCSKLNGFLDYGNIGIPLNKDDVWTKPISLDKWVKSLRDYDYLVLYNEDDDFVNLYGSIFESKESIVDKGVYKIITSDNDTKLELVK